MTMITDKLVVILSAVTIFQDLIYLKLSSNITHKFYNTVLLHYCLIDCNMDPMNRFLYIYQMDIFPKK